MIKKSLRKYLYFIFFTSVLIVVLSLFAVKAGDWLIVKDKLTQSDIILVLMGSPGDRILEARDIYKDSFAKKIVFIEDNDPGRKELKKEAGILLPNDAFRNMELAIKLGIPESSIFILPGDANSTLEEAKILVQYIKENPSLDSIILITSSYHSRRAGIIFGNELDKCHNDIKLFVTPSKYTDFKSEKWYSDRQSRKIVMLEYIKLINYYLFD